MKDYHCGDDIDVALGRHCSRLELDVRSSTKCVLNEFASYFPQTIQSLLENDWLATRR